MSLTASFTYKAPAADVSWPDGGDFTAYYYHLNHPNITGLNNSLFKLTLARLWSSDYCYSAWAAPNYQFLNLLPAGVTGPYCGYSSASSASVSASHVTYDISARPGRFSNTQKAAQSKAAKNNTLAVIENKSPVLHKLQTLKTATAAGTKKAKCTPDKTTFQDITISGKDMTRGLTVYGNCYPQYIVPGSVEIDYTYFNSSFLGATETDDSFYATYYRLPTDSNQSGAFDSMIQTGVKLKF